MIFRECWEDHRVELIFDFANYFQLDPADVFSEKLDVMRAGYLIYGLLKTAGSKLQAAKFEIPPRSREEQTLIAVHNAIVNGWHAKSSDKKSHLIKMDKPKSTKKEDLLTAEQQKERFSYITVNGEPIDVTKNTLIKH